MRAAVADRSRYLSVGLILALVTWSCTGDDAAPVPDRPTQTPAPTATIIPPTRDRSPTSSPSPTPTTPEAELALDATSTPTSAPLPLTALGVERAFPGLSFTRMVALAYPDDGTDRLFLVLQSGSIMVFRDDQTVSSADTFLDIRQRVSDRGNEEGLLGLAFDPQYARNGYFYVYYSASSPRRSVISRFSVSPTDPDSADPGSERIVLEVPQPYSNHNAGQIVFDPDGYLYIGLGDGGSAADPASNGQDRATLLGSILRIDVSALDDTGAYAIPADNPFVRAGDEAREEIWAYGLRNPWRFTFDRLTGDLWAGDVGQARYEEIDIVRPGLNYGWNVMEGLHCFSGSRVRSEAEACQGPGLALPVIEYRRDGGCSVTGGHVYRGERLSELTGAYVYADFCSGKIWALRHDGSGVTEHRLLAELGFQIPAFGEGPSGEIYILSFGGGIYRLKMP